MIIRRIQAKSILTPQSRGFLTAGAHPFTHSLSWAVGCGFGKLYCGAYCYAPKLPNWMFGKRQGDDWGEALIIKENAPALLERQLSKSRARSSMRIFMSPVTDPYQPIERQLRLSRRCLDIFARYDDIDLLLIQTRGQAVMDDFERIAALPCAWLSVTLETDRGDLPHGPSEGQIKRRLETISAAVKSGIKTQIAVSPCLPYSPGFPETLAETGAQRIVIDTFAQGDGSGGKRTGGSPFAAAADYDWRDEDMAFDLLRQMEAAHGAVAFGAEGFAGIPRRRH